MTDINNSSVTPSTIPTTQVNADPSGNAVVNGLVEIGRGMATVMKHFSRDPVTLSYPEERPDLSNRFHGRLALLTKSDGTDLCVGCKACARVCPCDDLIQIEMHRDENKKPVIDQFTIDIGRCIFCGNCTEVCPVDCIKMLPDFELADFSREALVNDKKDLTLSGEESDQWRRDHDMEPTVV
jgi:NADH-quinone oxidoreductase subunit I